MSEKLAEAVFHSTIRIVGIWPLFGLTDQPSRVFTDAIEYTDFPPELAELVHGYSDEFDHNDVDWEDVIARAALRRRNGYLLVADHPVYTKGVAGGASFSWGHYTSELFYADTVDEAITKAASWGDAAFRQYVDGDAA